MAKYIAEHGIDDTLMLTLTIVNDTNGLESTYFGSEINGNMYSLGGRISYKDNNFDVRKRSWYQEVIKENKTIISEPYISTTGQKLSITIAAPIYSNNTLIGVVGADTAIDKLSKEFVELGNAE
ncbi:cache domain-containing protein, partial [Campylobacter hyointestinalis]|uniref:cache domain-containing protein n=1 Tax=Campylobacter hyointestinalis TaxID=198 RepID=UPI000A66549F